jgi:LuxR family maltose regulon positive regulatory protein
MPAVGMAHIHLGRVLYARNDLGGATTATTSGVERLRGSIEQYLLAQGYALLAQVHLARGDTTAAFETFHQGEDWFTQMQVADTGAGTLLGLEKVRLQIRLNDLNAAIHWAQNCKWLPEDTHLGSHQAITLARLRLAQSRREKQTQLLPEVAEILDRQAAIANAGQWRGQLLELLVLRALLHRANNDTAAMLNILEQALMIAEPEGYLRVFVDEREPMRLLLLDYQTRIKKKVGGGMEGSSLRLLAYTDILLAAFSQPATMDRAEHQSLPEPLSERELDILRLIATGRSNQEIAEILVVAVSTVKSHINNLYGKLGTNRRTEAIAIGRELGLLSE